MFARTGPTRQLSLIGEDLGNGICSAVFVCTGFAWYAGYRSTAFGMPAEVNAHRPYVFGDESQ